MMKKPPVRTPVKPVPAAPTGGGRGRGGMTPPPGMMYGPNDRLIPIPKKGGAATGGGRAPIDSDRVIPRPTGGVRGTSGPKPARMKSGGMVKGKK